MALLFSFFSINPAAYADHSAVNDILSFEDDDEYDDVLRAVSESTFPESSFFGPAPDVSYCYKCYKLSGDDFDNIENVNDILRIISQQKPTWRAVMGENGLAYLNDDLKMYGYQPQGSKYRNYYDMNSTFNIVNNNRKLANVSDMYVIETPLTTLCLLITPEDAYIITYNVRPDFPGLKPGKLYSVKRVISSMKKYNKKQRMTNEEITRRDHIIMASVLTAISLTLVSGGYLTVRLIKRRRRASK